jgi:glycine dehydrogenase subunit 1
MAYVPHTEQDVREMLDVIGVDRIEDLFREIPADLLVKGELNIPTALDEARNFAHLRELSERNVDLSRTTCFLGAGIYDRFIPATVGAVISRGEYLTSYTPYQPEMSQGYLQTIYEFQTMVSDLFGMDLANASMYDGPTALAEGALMAAGIKNRPQIAVSAGLHPHSLEIIRTYCWAMGIEVLEIPLTNGATEDYSALSDRTAAVLVGYPNFLGIIEDLSAARAAADACGAMLVVDAHPTACALLKPPGEFGADIVTGEGQSLGVPMGFGGPLLGLFACKESLVRQIPGRIVGRAPDDNGNIGFTMTLRTREQDIRREKATSNICTNEALMALAATVYMSALGKVGMKHVAETTVRNTQYAIAAFEKAGLELAYPGRKVFQEFVVKLPGKAVQKRDELLEQGILAGHPLSDDELLCAFTELRTADEIDRLAAVLSA